MVSNQNPGFIITYSNGLEMMNREVVGPTYGDGTWRIQVNLTLDPTSASYDQALINFSNVSNPALGADPGGWESVRIIVTGATSGNVSQYTFTRASATWSTFVLVNTFSSYNANNAGTFSGTLPNVGEQTTMTLEFTPE